MAESLVIGIDPGRYGHGVVALGPGGDEILREHVANDATSIEGLVDRVVGLAGAAGRALWVIEADGGDGAVLIGELLARDELVATLTPNEVAARRKGRRHVHKSDLIDAELCARIGREQQATLRRLVAIPEVVAEVRVLARYQHGLIRDRTRLSAGRTRLDVAGFHVTADAEVPPGSSPVASVCHDRWAQLRARPLQRPGIEESCTPGEGTELSDTFALGRGGGPVYAVAGTWVSRDHGLANGEWSQHKVLWVADRPYHGLTLIRGMSLGGVGDIRLPSPTVPLEDRELRIDWSSVPPSRRSSWRELPTYTDVSAPGCYAWQVDTETGSDVIVFLVIPE